MILQRYLLAILIFLSISCKKEYSKEAGMLEDNYWAFREAGDGYSGPVDSAFYQSNTTGESIIIYGTSEKNNRGQFYLKITAEIISAGSYNGTGVQFQYSDGDKSIFQNDGSSTIAIVITEIDNEKVEGTFSGTVTDSLQQVHTITDGKFGCGLKHSENTSVKTLTVWAKEICSVNNKIEILVDNSSGFITNAMQAQPECNASGAAIFSVDAGEHVVRAICGSDTLIYQVTVTDECSYLEINLNNDYLPLSKTSYWEYSNLNDENVKQVFTSDGELDINGKTYTKLTGTRGTDYFYRKVPHIYIQYRELSFQEFVTNPPSVEIVILKDNLLKGQTWETEPLDIQISGVVRKIKLVSTIVNRDYSQLINGVLYNNLIRVNTELFFSPDDGYSYATSGSAYNTVFAKGKGIVNYNDMDINIEWGIRNLFISP